MPIYPASGGGYPPDNITLVLSNGDMSINLANGCTWTTSQTFNAGFTASSPVLSVDSSGNITTSGYAYIKGKNRTYQQNLTATTTTSTSAVLFGTSVAFTPKFSGYLVISAVIRASNNTIGDGVVIYAYQGASSGALTTLLDSETYTQEGLGGNEHTFVLHYELSNQTIGTAIYISLAFNAVTGGTASGKIVSFSIQEV